ncbi:DUF4372 domain-containing protein [Flavobacterium pectinovorum]|nr:DUF4372 domain-containing protein [Flavobacterium pectinovorum]
MTSKTVEKHSPDRCVKYFKSPDHLFSMIFFCLKKCNSL